MDNNKKSPTTETPDFEVPLPDEKIPFSPKEFGEMIHKRRKELNITQKRLAEALNVSFQAVSKIENGKTDINVEYAKKLARLLQCTPHYLLGYTYSKNGVDSYRAGDKRQENIIPILLSDENDIKDIRALEAKLHKDTELFHLLIKALDAPEKKRRKIRRIISILLE